MSDPTVTEVEIEAAWDAWCNAHGCYERDNIIDVLLAAARVREASITEAVEAERAACEAIARDGCLVPPDGGSPTEDERLMCEGIADAIAARATKSAT